MKWLIIACICLSGSLKAKEIRPLEKSYSYIGNNYKISYDLHHNFQEIKLSGLILSSLIEDLKGFKYVHKKLLRKDVPVRLVLDTGGGFQLLYNRFIRSIKKACNSEQTSCKITTIVPSGKMCASACIPTFMAGDLRIAGKYSRFGFHQFSVVPGALMLKGLAEKELLKKGADSIWVEMNRQMFESLTITWVNPHQLEGSNIVMITTN